MMLGSGGGAEREREARLAYDAPAWTTLLPAAVPRKKRSRCGPASSRSRAFRCPVPVPPPPEANKPTVMRKATRAGRCVGCGATETPQWRAGPTGPGTLCNSCGVRRRAAGERWGERRRPRRATARTVSDSDQQKPPPLESRPIPDPESSSPVGQICEQQGSAPAPNRVTSPPPATEEPSKKKKKNPPAKRNEGKLCDHCASSSTPKWRKGRHTLCNACAVRYSQGRLLLPEYRPRVSPAFNCTEHASSHSQVLELRRRRKDKQQLPVDLMMPLPGDINNDSGEAGASANPMDKPRSVGLDPFLLQGPAAPMIVDEEEPF